MASLEDVKAYIRQHSGESRSGLEGHVARQFGMSREEAARMLADLDSDQGAVADAGGSASGTDVGLPPVLLGAGVLAAGGGGVGSTGGTQGLGGAGAAALGLAAVDAADREGNDAQAGTAVRDVDGRAETDETR